MSTTAKYLRAIHEVLVASGYPEGHPDNIEEVPSFDSLTASEKRRARIAKADGKEATRVVEPVESPSQIFHLLKNMLLLFVVIMYFPLLVLKGIDHYWKYVFVFPFFPGVLAKWKGWTELKVSWVTWVLLKLRDRFLQMVG